MRHRPTRPSIDPSQAVRQEAQARALARPAAQPAATTQSPFGHREPDDRLPGGTGRKLPTPVRTAMEARFARDFSMVRVHDDATGHRAAEDSGGKALAYGNDVAFAQGAFAPDRPEGQTLIAHELVHVAQQQDTGIASVARDGPSGGGIGAIPPTEDFITMDTAGSEDAHALFGLNRAELSTAGIEAMVTALDNPTGPVTVHLHGYASNEGDPTWNRNLSAHRAVAAKKALEARLPEGSRIVLFAHGATAEFGTERKDNRRVGVSLIGPVRESGFTMNVKPLPPLRFGLDQPDPAAGRPDQPLLDPSKPLLPQLLPGAPSIIGPVRPDPLGFVVPPIMTRRDLVDLSAIGAGMAARGVAPGTYGDVLQLWDESFLRYRAMGLGDEWAARLANSQISGTTAAQAQRDAPNAIDRSNADWKAAHPDEFATPILQSPNLFELPSWFSKKKKP
jgi:hypothetical protein